ncbi:MAG TPA: NAD-dependent epimerase/dehydratase family protein, partial [Blastocatellia bacterium]|nr:NAD-dependent epimerase/dehydratase family protein [Blastocatellia bacterium]
MAILVTGGAGYIGSATVECLRSRGEKVVVLDDLARGHREALADDVPFFQGNVGDRALVARVAAEDEV